MQKRFMAIKKENRPHGKNNHEFKVLTEFRNGVSPFFPKYFVPINHPSYDIKENPLLMM